MSSKLFCDSSLSADNTNSPIIGLSTWQTTQEETDKAINAAIDAGYRLIDSAYGYSNESAIGFSLKKMFDRNKISRSDIIVLTKLPPTGNRPEDVEIFLKRSLNALKLDYVDYYLLGSPIGYLRQGESLTPRDENGDLLLDPNTDIVKIWKAMEAQVVAGRVKSIGLAHFNEEQIQRIIDNCSIRPANIQLEIHVHFQNKEMVSFCKRNGISVTAIVPFGAPGIHTFLENTNHPARTKYSLVFKEPAIVKIAKKYNKAPSQVILRYLLQYGVGFVLKTINPSRIKQCIDIYDFELTTEEYEIINDLDRGEDGRTCSTVLFPYIGHHPEYPFPT